MLDQIGIFLILVLLWVGFTFVFRRWLWHRVARRDITVEQGTWLHAAAFALLPLLALPWFPGSWPALLGAALFLLVFQVALARLYARFLRRNS